MNTKKDLITIELLKEFMDLYKNPPTVSEDIDGIIILAGDRPPAQGENVSRIKYAETLFKKLNRDLPVFFSGITGEKETITNLMISFGLPKENCFFQDCGKFGITNTKIQFETLASDPLTKDCKNLAIVTSAYHIPRVKRTAGKYLQSETKFIVVANIEDWKTYNSFLMVMDEIEKIVKYSVKRDILERPR
jgi:uncharacterized SAM-binding protein YcdF (DUF218 family)